MGISHLNHADVVVGAVVGTGRATDTGVVIDYYLSRSLDTVNRAGGATEHAHRIEAVHARVSHHQVLYAPAMSIEPRVVVMTHGARFRTRVTPDAAIQIDKHRLRAVDIAAVDQEFDYLWGKTRGCRVRPRHLRLRLRRGGLNRPSSSMLRQRRQNILLHNMGGHPENVTVAHCPERVLQLHRLAFIAPVMQQFL